MQGADEAELMRRIADGDRRAFREVVRRHGEAVHRAVLPRVPDPSTADDVVQEVLLGVWRGAASFRAEASLRGWILATARRQAARSWRRRAGEPVEHEPLSALGRRAGWASEDPEQAAMALEDHEQLHRALDTLAPADREILCLRDLEGLSGAETARVLGIRLGAAKSRLHRARLRLMAALRQGGRHDAQR